MGFELGEYHDREHLKEMIDQFSPEQLESLHFYMNILNKGFSGRRGPEGKVIRGFIDLSIERTGDWKTVATLPLRWEMYNGLGIVHGGIMATFIDNAMGTTLFMCHPNELVQQVTVDLNIHYLKGAKGKKLMAETELIQAGRSIAVLDCDVRDEKDDIVSKATGTFRVWTKS
ncbi:PaaI family thioesterase [Pueribacillus sp. YX66]|uniref:PaaI family thioesterase n=1 Tax=Pueribacillus sp. YX66 TaxID=3229242 RepID=UPI00358CF984